MNIRMLPPVAVGQQMRIANGRTYTGVPGVELDVPDFDAGILQANGWTWVAPSGPTSARPTKALGLYQATVGMEFFDATLGYLIKFDGSTWRNPATGAAV